jgi:hypothetical protein
VALVLAVLGIVNLAGGTPTAPTDGGTESGGGEAAPATIQVATGQDLDPFGDQEHPEDVELAYAGDPSTRWQTQLYNSASLDKPGVGMWVQAADGGQAGRAEIDLGIPGADVEVYGLATPPGGDPAAWGEPAARQSGASGTLTADLPEGSNVVLVWFTALGDDAGRHRGSITEIRLQP